MGGSGLVEEPLGSTSPSLNAQSCMTHSKVMRPPVPSVCFSRICSAAPVSLAVISTGSLQGSLAAGAGPTTLLLTESLFRGSCSLKSVLPPLVSGMSCDGVEVAEGNEAGLAREKMLHAVARSEERKRLREALLACSKQDTLAMVRPLKVLYERPRDR